jgi:hypothetical protein
MISHSWKVNDDELNETGDEATAAGQLSPLDKLGSTLVKQLMKVVDEGVGPITGSRDYAEARLAHFGDPEKGSSGSSPRQRRRQGRPDL